MVGLEVSDPGELSLDDGDVEKPEVDVQRGKPCKGVLDVDPQQQQKQGSLLVASLSTIVEETLKSMSSKASLSTAPSDVVEGFPQLQCKGNCIFFRNAPDGPPIGRYLGWGLDGTNNLGIECRRHPRCQRSMSAVPGFL